MNFMSKKLEELHLDLEKIVQEQEQDIEILRLLQDLYRLQMEKEELHKQYCSITFINPSLEEKYKSLVLKGCIDFKDQKILDLNLKLTELNRPYIQKALNCIELQDRRYPLFKRIVSGSLSNEDDSEELKFVFKKYPILAEPIDKYLEYKKSLTLREAIELEKENRTASEIEEELVIDTEALKLANEELEEEEKFARILGTMEEDGLMTEELMEELEGEELTEKLIKELLTTSNEGLVAYRKEIVDLSVKKEYLEKNLDEIKAIIEEDNPFYKEKGMLSEEEEKDDNKKKDSLQQEIEKIEEKLPLLKTKRDRFKEVIKEFTAQLEYIEKDNEAKNKNKGNHSRSDLKSDSFSSLPSNISLASSSATSLASNASILSSFFSEKRRRSSTKYFKHKKFVQKKGNEIIKRAAFLKEEILYNRRLEAIRMGEEMLYGGQLETIVEEEKTKLDGFRVELEEKQKLQQAQLENESPIVATATITNSKKRERSFTPMIDELEPVQLTNISDLTSRYTRPETGTQTTAGKNNTAEKEKKPNKKDKDREVKATGTRENKIEVTTKDKKPKSGETQSATKKPKKDSKRPVTSADSYKESDTRAILNRIIKEERDREKNIQKLLDNTTTPSTFTKPVIATTATNFSGKEKSSR